MLSKKIIYRILLTVVAATVLFFGYQLFFRRNPASPEAASPGLVAVGLTASPLDQATNEFLEILVSLQRIELQPDLFSHPVFQGLVDFSTELTPQVPGRVNPFAPIGSSVGTSSAAASGLRSAEGSAGGDLRTELLRTLNQ